MLKNLKIRNKIIITIAMILSATLLAVTMVVSMQANLWFSEEAEAKLAIAAKIVLTDINQRIEKMTRDVNILSEDASVISPISIIMDLIKNNPTQVLAEADLQRTKELAIRFKKISDTRQGFHLIRVYDANNNLIAFYDKNYQLAGWYKGGGQFSILKGNNKLLSDSSPPSHIVTKYPIAFVDNSTAGFDIFDHHLEMVIHEPLHEKKNDQNILVGLLVVDTFLDNQYAEDMSILLSSQINFFQGKTYDAGMIEEYTTLTEESYQALASQYSSSGTDAIQPINREININNNKYYEQLFPFGKGHQIIGAMSILYSQADADAKKMEAVAKLAILAVVNFIVGIGIAVAFSHVITRPIHQAVDISNQLADGELLVEITVDSKDETGQLLAAMKNMVMYFKEMLTNVRCTADTLAFTSNELQTRSQNMIESLTGQADKSNQIATASTEMSQTVINITQEITNIAAATIEATNIAKKGEDIVKQSIREVRSIADTVRAATKMVNSLGARSQQVGAIVNVINDVADQTNLLALNAAIEAARAGESGRGFAVVADEVKKLAERTAKATAEIHKMIKDMQNEVHLTVDTMAASSHSVEIGAELSNQAGLALGNIVNSVATLRSMVEHIAAATEEMSVVTEQTTQDIVEISMISQQAVSNFREISQSAVNMSEMSDNLQNNIGKFHMDG